MPYRIFSGLCTRGASRVICTPYRIFFAIALASAVLAAQPLSLTGPVAGFVFDVPTHGFRRIIGFPGSAVLQQPAIDGFDAGFVGPQKDYAIALKAGRCALVQGLGSTQPSVSEISGIFGAPDSVQWSGDGSVAVLYSQAGSWIQPVTGLPNAPVAGDVIDVSSFPGTLSSVAIDRTGKMMAAGFAGGGAGVFLAPPGQPLLSALQVANPVALAFSSDGQKLYVLDAAAPALLELNVADFSAQPLPLDGLGDPVAVAIGTGATGRALLYVASRSDRLFRIYDASTHDIVADLPLDFAPDRVISLSSTSYVLCARQQDGDPLWVFTSAPGAAVFFVPAPPAAEEPGQ